MTGFSHDPWRPGWRLFDDDEDKDDDEDEDDDEDFNEDEDDDEYKDEDDATASPMTLAMRHGLQHAQSTSSGYSSGSPGYKQTPSENIVLLCT